MFLRSILWVKQLLVSGMNQTLTLSYLSRGCFCPIGLNWAKKWPKLLFKLILQMFLKCIHWLKQLLYSGLNWILAAPYCSNRQTYICTYRNFAAELQNLQQHPEICLRWKLFYRMNILCCPKLAPLFLWYISWLALYIWMFRIYSLVK